VTQRLLRLVKRDSSATATAHDAVFIARYTRLCAHARRLCGGDRSLADDLVQDAYVQFTTSQPDLAPIQDLDAYLATLVRNLHVSLLRRGAAHRFCDIAIHEFDSAASALAFSTSEDRIRARDTLVRLCKFVCLRKDTSKAASVFLLRFFHDLYPSEIAWLLRTTPEAVHAALWQIRSEVRLRFTDSQQPCAIAPRRMPRAVADDPLAATGDTIAHLRALIFSTGRPPCLPARAIDRWHAEPTKILDPATCAHVSSCPECLERLCDRLERLSVEPPSPPDDGHGSSDRGATSGGTTDFRRKARRRARGLREHRPQQLEVSVNGHPVGMVRVTSDHNEFRWTVRLDEPVAFAELHSEQNVRMALLHVDLPPEGRVVQQVALALSDNRSLRLALDFAGLHPVIAVEYVDPALRPVIAEPQPENLAPPQPAAAIAAPEMTAIGVSWWRRLSNAWRHTPQFVAVTTGVVVVLLAAGSLWSHLRSGVPTASALIDEAVASEGSGAPSSTGVHRTLRFQMRRADTATVAFAHRIDAWTRDDTGARAVRVFDRTGHLVAGHWHTGEVIELGVLDDVWQMDLSATAFRARYTAIGPCTTAADPASYSVTCERPSTRGLLDLMLPTVHAQATTQPSRAMLVLRRPDLHAIRVELAVLVEGVRQIVTLEEGVFARVPVADIPANIFVPDTRRLSSAVPAEGNQRTPLPSIIATPSLEVRLVDVVDRLTAGDRLTVRRTDTNRLSVTGLVSTVEEKRTLLNAVSRLDVNGLIATAVQTVDEVAARERPTSRNQRADPNHFRLLESVIGTAAIDEYIRTRVPRGTDATTVVRELTPRVLELSERVKRHGRALNGFVDRFDDGSIAGLDVKGRRAWQALLGRHATEMLTALERLDTTLAPYFDGTDGQPESGPESLRAASHRLANEATTVDEALRGAFTASEATTASQRTQAVVDVRQHVRRAWLDAHFIRDFIQP
jgi:DNA-directed RNA polymerase specialized sigma24 family protein